jgi:hypothetical protein
MLAGASNVRKVGTGTIDGVAVTEYTGTLSLDKGIQYLSGSVKAQVQKEISAVGLTTATFTVWIDGQHTVRKAIIHENGANLTETIAVTDTLTRSPWISNNDHEMPGRSPLRVGGDERGDGAEGPAAVAHRVLGGRL